MQDHRFSRLLGTRTRRPIMAGIAVGAALTLAACGGNSYGSSSGSTGSGSGAAHKSASAKPSMSKDTVSSNSVDGATVLVDSAGKTLYFTEQEKSGKIRCTGGCVDIWMPVTVSAGKRPTGGSNLPDKLGTIKRSDGKTQVTYNGMPLYSFTLDKAPGSMNGNTQDEFGGVHFTWHAMGADGKAAKKGSGSSGGGGGGYNY